MADVFLSYSSQNAGYVRQLAQFLRAAGFDVWFDDHIETGSSWSDTIFSALDSSAAFIVVMTPPALNSTWVERECLYAEKRGKPRFPLLLEGEEFPFLIDVQYTDVRGGQMPPDAYLDLLREAVTNARAAAPAAPAAPATLAATASPARRRTARNGAILAALLLAVMIAGFALLNAAPPRTTSATPASSAAVTAPPRTTSAELLPPPIEPGLPVRGVIDDTTPEYWYQLSVDRGARLTIRMEALSGDLDPYFELYGPGYTFLAYNDELDDNFDDSSLEAGLTRTVLRAGIHFIRAMRFPAKNGQPVTSGEFRLTVQVEPGH